MTEIKVKLALVFFVVAAATIVVNVLPGCDTPPEGYFDEPIGEDEPNCPDVEKPGSCDCPERECPKPVCGPEDLAALESCNGELSGCAGTVDGLGDDLRQLEELLRVCEESYGALQDELEECASSNEPEPVWCIRFRNGRELCKLGPGQRPVWSVN